MVNTELLTKHAAQFKAGKESAIEYYKQLFTKHPDVAEAYGADGIDPDSIGHSQKFVMMAASELQFFFQLPKNFDQERQWRSALSNFKEQFGDMDASLVHFNVRKGALVGRFTKLTDAFLATMSKYAGGLSAEQKKNWEELLAKAYADMKKWGWY